MFVIKLGKPTLVSGLVIQGRGNYAQWVTEFNAGCKRGNSVTGLFNSNGAFQSGNSDQNTPVVINYMPKVCEEVHIYPRKWFGWPSMRAAVLSTRDCGKSSPKLRGPE